MLVHCRVTPSTKFANTHLYTFVERGTVRVKCIAQEHTQFSWPGLEPEPLQGSCGSWKTWKVMEFYDFIFQAWKVLKFSCGSWKVMEYQYSFYE